MEDLNKQIEELTKKVERLEQKRVFQQDVVPGAIKMRAMGEGSRFMRGGLEADLPTVGENATDSVAYYFATDTDKLYIFNGTAWVSATLS